MKIFDPLETRQNIRIAWLDLVKCYESAGLKVEAGILLKELSLLTEANHDSPSLRDKYFTHLQEWENLNVS